MFNNIGRKIKALAITLAGLGLGFSVVYLIVLIKDNLLKVGANAVILITLISWVCAFVLYGFGQLVENSDKLVKMKEAELAEKQKADAKKVKPLEKDEKEVKEEKISKPVKVETKDVLKDISSSLKEKIKKIVNASKEKVEGLKKEKADWFEEIKSLKDKELVDRIDNDHSWQYSYIILCCYEYNERLNPKKETPKGPDKKTKK